MQVEPIYIVLINCDDLFHYYIYCIIIIFLALLFLQRISWGQYIQSDDILTVKHFEISNFGESNKQNGTEHFYLQYTIHMLQRCYVTYYKSVLPSYGMINKIRDSTFYKHNAIIFVSKLVNKLQVFINKCLCNIFGIFWPDTIFSIDLWDCSQGRLSCTK